MPGEVSDARKWIGLLEMAGGVEAEEALPRALVHLFGEEGNARSLATYGGLAREVRARSGVLSPDVLISALEEASRAGVRNRGASFIAAVKRRKGEVYRRRRGSACDLSGVRASPG